MRLLCNGLREGEIEVVRSRPHSRQALVTWVRSDRVRCFASN